MHYRQEVTISGGIMGPVVTYKRHPKHVIISWDSPPTTPRTYRQIIPPISYWTELDGDYYDLGKKIYSFLRRGNENEEV